MVPTATTKFELGEKPSSRTIISAPTKASLSSRMSATQETFSPDSSTIPLTHETADKSNNRVSVQSFDSQSITGRPDSKASLYVRQLSSQERVEIGHAIGAFAEDQEVFTTTLNVRKLPDGLYRNVILAGRKSKRMYKLVSFAYNLCLVMQLLLGAVLTALGASDIKMGNRSLAITVLAAGNTVNAGFIALLHNSGLPARFRNDYVEYSQGMYLDV